MKLAIAKEQKGNENQQIADMIKEVKIVRRRLDTKRRERLSIWFTLFHNSKQVKTNQAKLKMIGSAASRIARANLSSSSPSSITIRTQKHLASQSNRRCFSSTSDEKKILYDVVPKDDFGQYKEYSVIFTNRALNLMSDPFQKVMRDLNTLLKETYKAKKVAIIPG